MVHFVKYTLLTILCVELNLHNIPIKQRQYADSFLISSILQLASKNLLFLLLSLNHRDDQLQSNRSNVSCDSDYQNHSCSAVAILSTPEPQTQLSRII